MVIYSSHVEMKLLLCGVAREQGAQFQISMRTAIPRKLLQGACCEHTNASGFDVPGSGFVLGSDGRCAGGAGGCKLLRPLRAGARAASSFSSCSRNVCSVLLSASSGNSSRSRFSSVMAVRICRCCRSCWLHSTSLKTGCTDGDCARDITMACEKG